MISKVKSQIKMDKTSREAALIEKKRQEINYLKEQRKERLKSGVVTSFSGKKKKEQLRARKERLRVRRQEAVLLEETNEYESFYMEAENRSAIMKDNPDFQSLNEEPDFYAKNGMDKDFSLRLKLTVALGKNNRDCVGKELSSYFVKETEEQIHLRLMEGQRALDTSKRNSPLISNEIIRDPLLDHPRRPAWNYNMSKVKVDNNESIMFDKWLTNIHNKYDNEHLNHFEHNLEVWRELWRVTERATHVVLVTDARNPLLHIPPSIYNLVIKELQKPLIIVLNKTDLVPHNVIDLWKKYLKARFFNTQILCFSSRSDAVLGDENIAARRRVLSKKLEVGDQSAVTGAARILSSCGIDDIEAQRIVEELNANLENIELENNSSTIKKKKSRRRQKKNHNQNDGKDEVGLLCTYCGCEDAVFACLSCSSSASKSSSKVEKISRENAIATDYLICDRCYHEAHEHSKDHIFVRLAEENSNVSDGIDVTHRGPKVTIGLIGHPNVGKSSVLNALAGKKIVSVSHTPGHTKRLQSIMITPDICICDCPGLVFPFAGIPKFLQELCGLYPYSQIREPFSAVRFLAEHVNLEKILDLKPRTHLFDGEWEKMEWTPWTICEAYAEKKGYRTDRRGRPDHQRAGSELIRDSVDGIVPLFFFPPNYTGIIEKHEFYQHESNAIQQDPEEKTTSDDDGEENKMYTYQKKGFFNGFELLDRESERE